MCIRDRPREDLLPAQLLHHVARRQRQHARVPGGLTHTTPNNPHMTQLLSRQIERNPQAERAERRENRATAC
eukprot:8707704-Pyramimonas_sp.AAC.2